MELSGGFEAQHDLRSTAPDEDVLPINAAYGVNFHSI
jgi:hypothetical protein